MLSILSTRNSGYRFIKSRALQIKRFLPKIGDRILSSMIRSKIGVKSGIPGTRYQIQRFGSCPGIPSCFLSAILDFYPF